MLSVFARLWCNSFNTLFVFTATIAIADVNFMTASLIKGRMRGTWSTGRTSRQDADVLGSTRQESRTTASNGYSNLEVDNEDIIARYENDMNRLGLRPSSPNSIGATKASNRDVRKLPVAKTTAAAPPTTAAVD